MEPERIELSAKERERLKVLHEVEQGHLKQVEAARRLRLTDRHVRRLQARLPGLEPENSRDLGAARVARLAPGALSGIRPHAGRRAPGAPGSLGQPRDAAEMDECRRIVAAALPARESRACVAAAALCFRRAGDDGQFALSLVGGSRTEENLRTLGGWLVRHGRPLALYTDKNSLFHTSRPVQWQEQLRGDAAHTQFGRALAELGIEWIAAHSPQAKGRIERLFGTLQDRLVKEMRLEQIATLEQANRFLEMTFWPFWQQRFAVPPAAAGHAHRPLERTQRLEEILSVRVARTVAADHTVSWEGRRWGLRREHVCAGKIERRLDGSHWLRFRGRYLPLQPCPAAPRSATPSGLRPAGVADQKPNPQTKIKTKRIPSPDHPWRKPWKRTFLLGRKPDISTLR